MLPDTPKTLLSRLAAHPDGPLWQDSWRRFLELYHRPIAIIAESLYRRHTGGAIPPAQDIEDITACVIVDFVRAHLKYDAGKSRLRTYLRRIINAKVVDHLRRAKPLNHRSLDASPELLPPESPEEDSAYREAILVTLVEELRETIPLRQFEIFERVKLKGISPEAVAAEMGVRRGVVDNAVYKTMTRLRELAGSEQYQQEYHG